MLENVFKSRLPQGRKNFDCSLESYMYERENYSLQG